MTVAEHVELRVRSAFSFFDGASTPEELAARAAEMGHGALALADLADVGGAVRFAEACDAVGVRPIAGVALPVEGLTVPITVLCEDGAGWANANTLATLARAEERGEPSVTLDQLSVHTKGLVALVDGAESLAAAEPLRELFGRGLYVAIADHELAECVPRIAAAMQLSERLDRPWLVSGDVRHAAPHDKPVQDAMVCLRHRCSIDEAGDRLFPNDARHLREPASVVRRWCDHPSGVLRTLEVAERCCFRLLRDLTPELPAFGGDHRERLEALAREGFRRRYSKPSERHHAQLRRELDLVHRLGLAGYFLIVHDLVAFAEREAILVQGRGSAANSVLCYVLGITAVDPIGHELLFERFLSEGRGEPPDIDIDVAHQRREELLQYVYERHGRDHAAMVCEAITWKGRSAVRDAARILGFSTDLQNRLAEEVGHAVPSDARDDDRFAAGDATARLASGGLARAGLDPRGPRAKALLRLVRGLLGKPRHRGIHVGGFVLSARPLYEVVAIEPASMAGRTVIQWDKDDLPPLGMVKIDLLGLGMLTVLADGMARVRETRGEPLSLHGFPPDDPATFAMIRDADTVGIFQVESRAQMNTLPQTQPERFYDLVVQVALVRPGPIQGDMVHPYLRRRRGKEDVSYLHPSLEPVLRRTLGVPLFQEQGMKVAIVAAGFTPDRADALRRAMGRKRSKAQMARLSLELLQGMERNGIERSVAERIVKQLAAFASYGFPESHAASFAHLVYASAFLKRHFAPELYAAVLDAQPMGFYPVGSVIADARRHGVEVRGPDVNRSEWRCTLEARAHVESADPFLAKDHPFALRLGLRLIKGLGDRVEEGLAAALERRPFHSVADFAEKAELPRRALLSIARAGALDSLVSGSPGRARRQAAWNALAAARRRAGPLDRLSPDTEAPLPAASESSLVLDEYRAYGGTTRAHPIAFVAERRARAGMPTLAGLRDHPAGPIRVVGLVISRQRPETAKGFVFLALEDETGIANVVIRPALFDRQARIITTAPVLYVEGTLERRDDVVNVIARTLKPVRGLPSR